jgi:hypothetical protein
MRACFRFALRLAIVSVAVTAVSTAVADDTTADAAASEAKPVRSVRDRSAVAKWLYSQYDCKKGSIEITRLDTYDFKHDGRQEFILVAATCNTGTAGPDVHAILERNGKNEFRELPTPDLEKKYYEQMIGHANYDYLVKDNLLIERWKDSADRGSPLVVKYKWDGHKFIMASVFAPFLQ